MKATPAWVSQPTPPEFKSALVAQTPKKRTTSRLPLPRERKAQPRLTVNATSPPAAQPTNVARLEASNARESRLATTKSVPVASTLTNAERTNEPVGTASAWSLSRIPEVLRPHPSV